MPSGSKRPRRPSAQGQDGRHLEAHAHALTSSRSAVTFPHEKASGLATAASVRSPQCGRLAKCWSRRVEPTRVRRSGSTGSSQLDLRLLRNGKRKHRPQRLKEEWGPSTRRLSDPASHRPYFGADGERSRASPSLRGALLGTPLVMHSGERKDHTRQPEPSGHLDCACAEATAAPRTPPASLSRQRLSPGKAPRGDERRTTPQ